MSSSGPTGTTLPPRVCDRCGLLAEDTHYFCKGCRNRLPDPGQTARPTPAERPALVPSIPRAMSTPSARRGRKGPNASLQILGSMLVAAVVIGFIGFGLRPWMFKDFFRDNPSEVAVAFLAAVVDGDCELAIDLAAGSDAADVAACEAEVDSLDETEVVRVQALSHRETKTSATAQIELTDGTGASVVISVWLREVDGQWRVTGSTPQAPTIRLPVPQVPPAGTQGP